MTLEEKIKEIISEKLGVSLEEITPSSSFAEDLGTGPIEMADLLVFIEEEFKISLPEEEKKKIETIDQLINLVSSQISEV